MRKSKNELPYWLIVWLILYGALVFFFGFAFGANLQVVQANEQEELEPAKCFEFNIDGVGHSFDWLRSTMKKLETGLIVKKAEMEMESLEGADLYRFYIAQINEQYYPDVDPYIVLAVLELESNYVPNLTSSAGAVGLMQWIPKWHAWRMVQFGFNDPWDPYTNIIVGVDILNDNFNSTGSWQDALYLYNHSTAYVNAVLARSDLLRESGYFG